MNITITMSLQKPLTILDDKLIYGKKEIPFSSITEVTLTPYKDKNALCRTITITYGGIWKCIMPSFNPQNNEHNEAIGYLLSCVDKDLEKTFKNEKEIEEKGFRKQCKVCGKVFCYTFDDLKKNEQLRRSAGLAGLSQMAGALSGNYAAGATMGQTANDQESRIVDYDKCPSCGSRDLVDITDEDLARINAKQNGGSAVSTADELKKFKELLDSGIITQEEFDAKKKQLLGL